MQNNQEHSWPPLREVIAEYQLSADKRFGQHYLLDMNLLRRVVREANVHSHSHVLEIGPGPGGLTRALLETGATVTVIERDHRFLPALESLSKNLTIIQQDALKTDFSQLSSTPMQVVANLPYNISSPLLVKLLQARQYFLNMTLMFQKEVAERIVAQSSSKTYGRLSVLSQLTCHTQKLFDVSPSAFTPPPKVWSAVVQLTPLPDVLGISLQPLEKLTAAAFGQRRKMLKSSLKPLLTDAVSILQQADIDPAARAETVTPAQYQQLLSVIISSGK